MDVLHPITAGFYYTSGENAIFGNICRAIIKKPFFNSKYGLKTEAAAITGVFDGVIEVEADIELQRITTI